MKNLAELMRQAQSMQSKMTEMQAKMADMEAFGEAGGGLVKATVGGKGDLRRLSIDPSLVVATEKEILEDLVIAAVNDARAKVDAKVQAETQKLISGLKLPPGVKLPF